MEEEDGYMAIQARKSLQQTSTQPDQESSKHRCWKVLLWVLLAASLLLNVVLMALLLVFQQQHSCPQNLACSCDGIPGSSTAHVTLNPDTAHPRIDLSSDGKTAAWGETVKSMPDNKERFDHRVWVLGSEGFLSEKHCWEVAVKGSGEWGVGVAKQSVQRKGLPAYSTHAGVWGIGEYRGVGNFVAFTSPEMKKLPLDKTPRRIRVSLDYKNGQVEFFNAETKVSIYLFNSSSFGGEKIYPWFRVWDGSTLVLHP